jgi:hypothetical protein
VLQRLVLCIVLLDARTSQCYSWSKQGIGTDTLANPCRRDWGRQGLHNQSDVAAVMGEVAHTTRPDFVISTGDNFYDCEPDVWRSC